MQLIKGAMEGVTHLPGMMFLIVVIGSIVYFLYVLGWVGYAFHGIRKRIRYTQERKTKSQKSSEVLSENDPDGRKNVSLRFSLDAYKDGERDIRGRVKEAYYDNGQLKGKCHHKDGELDGPFESYYENGQLRQKGTFKAGKPHGPFESYDENGQLNQKKTYKDGELDGPSESYENGRLRHKGTFKAGKPHGPSELYHENGQLGHKGAYKDGEWIEDGETETYPSFTPGGN